MDGLRNLSDFAELASLIKRWGQELGFQQVGISDTDLSEAEKRLDRWLEAGRQGTMDYIEKHGLKRTRPEILVSGTKCVISVRMDYLPPGSRAMASVLEDPASAFISRYALGRDYHKVLRKRLQKLTERIQAQAGQFGCRVFVDSAPVMEKALAEKAGLGWIGKHTNLINRDSGSWFFLGEIYTDLPLPPDDKADGHCGTCTACLDVCPTRAIIAPYQLDARRCISYLTIELCGSIPEELRAPMGNRIYGCDDCQLVCPWNRFAVPSPEVDFLPRNGLDDSKLVELFSWDEENFLKATEGSAIRRIGYVSWLRNIAVALGNGAPTPTALSALSSKLTHSSEIVREHVRWALDRLKSRDDRPNLLPDSRV